MKIRSLIALSLVAAVSVAAPASAQQPQASPAGVNVALIDISHVFKNHEGFKQKTEAIKQEIKDFETQMNEQRKVVNQKRAKLNDFQAGSAEYQKLEAELAQEIANQNVSAELKKKEIFEREAKIYYETYQEIVQAVEAFARHHNIGLVLRYDSEEIDPNDRSSVLRGVNRQIVYQDQINISNEILHMLNQQQAHAVAQPARPAAPARAAAAPARGTAAPRTAAPQRTINR